MSEIKIFGTVTDMAGTTVQRKKYFMDLQDGEKQIKFVLVVTEADGGLVAEPYVPAQDYGYDDYDEDEEDEGGCDPDGYSSFGSDPFAGRPDDTDGMNTFYSGVDR